MSEKEKAPHEAGQKNNSPYDSIIQYAQEVKKKNIEKIVNAAEIETLGDVPIQLTSDQRGIINFIIADAGAGKTLLVQKMLEYLYFYYDPTAVVLYFDFEGYPSLLKERRIHDLLNYDNFYLFMYDDIERIHNSYVKSDCAFIYSIVEFVKLFRKNIAEESKMIVVIDPYEELVTTVEKTDIVRQELNLIMSVKNVVFIINHHINKNQLQSDEMRFAGSRAVKAKSDSMLYLLKKNVLDDGSINFAIKVVKTKFHYENIEITVKCDTDKSIKIVNKVAAGKAKMILGVAYSVLKKQGSMTKNLLTESIRERLHKRLGVNKIFSTLTEFAKYFDVKRGEKNSLIYSLPTDEEKRQDFFNLLGWSDLSETKKELLNLISTAELLGYVGEVNIVNITYANLGVLRKAVYYQLNEEQAKSAIKEISAIIKKLEKET